MARPPPMLASPPCELCHSPAHLLCPSDDAFLCWRCDSMVHSANFLVARHHRTYLCSGCACLTTMVASGSTLRWRIELCAHCSIVPTEDCCSSGSGNSDSECSTLTGECDAESVPSPGACGSQLITSCFTSRRKQPFEFELQVCNGNLDVLLDSDVSDDMSCVEDEFSSSGGFGTLSPTSDIGNDPRETADSHGRQGKSFRRSSKA